MTRVPLAALPDDIAAQVGDLGAKQVMILRTATLHQSPYEWHQHRRMAAEAGVSDNEIAELEMWRTSRVFSPDTRAALAFTDAIVAGDVPEHVNEELAAHFDVSQRIELTVTAAFYSMVPRVLEALEVPIEEDPVVATG